MRGVNLNIFDFDYDLVWAGFFMNADERIYGRFGGRDASSPDRYLTSAGLKYAMQKALAAHIARSPEMQTKPAKPPRTVDQYPAAKRLKEDACIHCHQAYDFQRDDLRAASQWQQDHVWVYPLPENLGFTLDAEQGNRVTAVVADSPSGHGGLRAGDTLRSLNGLPVASFADVQHALHRAPAKGRIAVSWQRDGRTEMGGLALAEGWRKTDLSWRASTRRLGPTPCVHGEDLAAAEKRALGLPENRLAFRQGNFVAKTAQQAGIRQNDIILGVDDRILEMSARQFGVYVRLNYRVGDQVTYNVLREGARLRLPLKLPNPDPY
jgi:hypothetical protein